MKTDNIEKKRFKIRDVCELLDIPASTLRYWEKEVPYLKPSRTSTNRRVYSPSDIETLRIIHFLIKIRGLKIEAAKEHLKNNRNNISKRLKILDELNDIRDTLNIMLKSLEKRRD